MKKELNANRIRWQMWFVFLWNLNNYRYDFIFCLYKQNIRRNFSIYFSGLIIVLVRKIFDILLVFYFFYQYVFSFIFMAHIYVSFLNSVIFQSKNLIQFRLSLSLWFIFIRHYNAWFSKSIKLFTSCSVVYINWSSISSMD